MAVIRVEKTKDYTVMSNTHLRERAMSLKAKGLLSLMFSLPQEWDYSIAGLVAICREKESAIVATLKELKQFGYLEVQKHMPTKENGGRIEYEYTVYERPRQEKQGIEKQGIENQGLEIQGIENQAQLNTNELNTNILNTKELNTNDIGEKRKRFVPPSLDEVKAYCIERKNNVDAERFIDYYTANGWQVGKNKMKDWKAAVRTWERNGFSNNSKSNETKQGSFDISEFSNAAMKRSRYGGARAALEREVINRANEKAQNPPKTAAEDKELQEKIERLKEKLEINRGKTI